MIFLIYSVQSCALKSGLVIYHTDERFFVRQLTNLLKEDSTNISRELARLEKMGILVLTTSGRQKYYQANSRSPIFNELHGLIVKPRELPIFYVSVCSGGSKYRAGIYLWFNGKKVRDQSQWYRFDDNRGCRLRSGDRGLEAGTGDVKQRDKFGDFPVTEFQSKVRTNQHFLKSVLEEEKIYIIGDEMSLHDWLNEVT